MNFPWKIGTSVNFQHYTGLPNNPSRSLAPMGLTQGTETVILHRQESSGFLA